MKSKVLTKAVSYLRCTGLGQVDGDTWDRQTAAIAKYAKTHGLQLVDEFRDAIKQPLFCKCLDDEAGQQASMFR
jgi:DNA invertase Pin-like site-specific DNA recombinase